VLRMLCRKWGRITYSGKIPVSPDPPPAGGLPHEPHPRYPPPGQPTRPTPPERRKRRDGKTVTVEPVGARRGNVARTQHAFTDVAWAKHFLKLDVARGPQRSQACGGAVRAGPFGGSFSGPFAVFIGKAGRAPLEAALPFGSARRLLKRETEGADSWRLPSLPDSTTVSCGTKR